MRRALQLALRAQGLTSPDPLVGAVLVKNGRIIAEGYHSALATPHAEAWAIRKAGGKARGASLYINLEPCGHYGHNPPCVDQIIAAGIKEVVVATQDPNPLVNGKGFAALRRHGIKVRVGLLQTEAQQMNEVFFHYMTRRRPFVVVKVATTLDGKIATRTGKSKWISSPASLVVAHKLRALYDAVVVGVGTVLADDPQLTVRLTKPIKQPVRVILDSLARTPLAARVLREKLGRTIIFVSPKAPRQRIRALQQRGVEVYSVASKGAHLSMTQAVKKLGELGYTSLLIEGGGEVIGSAIEAGVVDKVHFVLAPKIFGGRDAKTAVEGLGVSLPKQAKRIKNLSVTRVGDDFLLTGYLN